VPRLLPSSARQDDGERLEGQALADRGVRGHRTQPDTNRPGLRPRTGQPVDLRDPDPAHRPGPLPDAIHVEDFDSYAAIQAAFAAHTIPAEAEAILYDNERWPGTPVSEQRQPFSYVQRAEALVHDHGLTFISTPAPDLSTTLNPGHHGNYSGYLNERLATLARYADIFDVQAQHAGPPASYAAFARAAVAQARAANRHAFILLGITTNGETAQDLISEVTATRAIADGYWLNIIGGNPGVQTAVPVLHALGYG
jgi:hypothetical protein